MPTRLSANQYVDMNFNGHVRFKDTSLLKILKLGLGSLQGIHQSQVLAIYGEHESRLYITRTQFIVLKSLMVRYAHKLVANDILTAMEAAQLNLEVTEFENKANELTVEYTKNSSGGNFEEVIRA